MPRPVLADAMAAIAKLPGQLPDGTPLAKRLEEVAQRAAVWQATNRWRPDDVDDAGRILYDAMVVIKASSAELVGAAAAAPLVGAAVRAAWPVLVAAAAAAAKFVSDRPLAALLLAASGWLLPKLPGAVTGGMGWVLLLAFLFFSKRR